MLFSVYFCYLLFTETGRREKRHRISFVITHKCYVVHCHFSYSEEEAADIFSFPRDVYISKFSSMTRLKISKKIFSLQDTHLNNMMSMLYSTHSLITKFGGWSNRIEQYIYSFFGAGVAVFVYHRTMLKNLSV